MDTIAELLNSAIIKFVADFFSAIVSTFTVVIGNEMQFAIDVLNNELIKNATVLIQVVAGSLLIIKVIFEAIKINMMRDNGEATNAEDFVTRTALAAATITCSPWIVEKAYTFGNELALDISRLPSVGTQDNFITALGSLVTAPVPILIVAVIALIIWVLILLQTAIRGVELGALSVVGPLMALGLTKQNQGIFAVWWRELLVLSLTQALQTLMIKGFLSQTIDIATVDSTMKLLLGVAWLWVAFKTPNFLRQFAYHSGIGGAIGGVTQQAGTVFVIRKMMTRGV